MTSLNTEAYPWIDNIISDDNLGLNLYIIYTVCHKVITLDGQSEMLGNS